MTGTCREAWSRRGDGLSHHGPSQMGELPGLVGIEILPPRYGRILLLAGTIGRIASSPSQAGERGADRGFSPDVAGRVGALVGASVTLQ